MKKFFTFIASVALIFAASCNKAEIAPSIEPENTPNEEAVVDETPAQTELLTVVLNPATKTSLSGKQTVWSEGDEVSVTVGGKVIGTLALVEGNTFSGEVEAGHEGEAVLNYPAGVTEVPASQVATAGTFAEGAALLEGTTTIAALRDGKGAELVNTTALLSFSVATAGDVVFTLGDATYTVTGCKTGETYYVCVAPVEGEALSYTLAKKEGAHSAKSVTFEAGKVYNIGNLECALESRNLAFSQNSITAYTNYDVTLPTLNGVKDGVTYSSSNTSTATVDNNGTVTIKAEGTTIITATAPQTATHQAGTATYTLNVEQKKIKIYVYLYPKEKGWSEWQCNPYIYYFDSKTVTTNNWPGVEMTKTATYDGKNRNYYEFPYSSEDKISVVITNNNCNNNFKQTVDIKGLSLNSDHSIEVWTDWQSDGKLKVGLIK